MRLLLELTATKDMKYDVVYHHKLRGQLWNLLKDTPLEELHGVSRIPTFTFSNPFPRENYTEGQTAYLLISSTHYDLIQTFEKQLRDTFNLQIGEMEFKIENIKQTIPDVGEPGSTGVLQCDTGIHLRIDKKHREKYDIQGNFGENQSISWTPDYPLQLFHERFLDNLNWKLDTTTDTGIEKPTRFNEVIDEVEFGEVYPIKVPVTTQPEGYKKTFVVPEVRFNYIVRNESHRIWLNTLLDCGCGWRNALGFGFLNIRE
jgi:CRISPR-associated endoribonuclease Cas6